MDTRPRPCGRHPAPGKGLHHSGGLFGLANKTFHFLSMAIQGLPARSTPT